MILSNSLNKKKIDRSDFEKDKTEFFYKVCE